MRWTDHAIWWHVYTLGFCGAPIHDPSDHGHRLRRLLGWLDYAVELGVSGLLLGPLSPSSTHGYDVLDHFGVDPRLGTDDDFDDLVDACRARGLRIVLDGVFSHVGRDHPWYRSSGPEAALFDIDRSDPGRPEARRFEGHDSLVRLDHTNGQTVDLVRRVMRHWLARGVDGWRLDAAYSVAPAFWAKVLPDVRAEFPDAWFVGEMIHGDYAGFVEASGVDTVTQYELWKAIWSSIVDRNLHELDWALARHTGFLAGFTPQTFVGNHDVTRIATSVGPDGAVVALAILMTVGGIPSVYYGDEQAFVGVKENRAGGDDAIRPSFPEDPDHLAPWGEPVHRAHQDLIGLRRRHPWLTTAMTRTDHVANTRMVYRTTAGDGSDHLDVELDLSGSPRATIRDRSGSVLWTA